MAYAELHCKTNFSFLVGASHPEELVTRAAELGHAALAITDQNSLAGVVRAHVAAKAAGLKLIIGAEITPEDAPPVLLFAPDLAAYKRLSSLITRGRGQAEKGACRLRLADVADFAEGLIAAVLLPLPPVLRGERAGEREDSIPRDDIFHCGDESQPSPGVTCPPHPLPLSPGVPEGEGSEVPPTMR